LVRKVRAGQTEQKDDAPASGIKESKKHGTEREKQLVSLRERLGSKR